MAFVQRSLFYVVLFLYSILLVLLGYWGSRKTKSFEDWALAGRNVGPWFVAFSYGATYLSTVAIIGFGGLAYFMGLSQLWIAAGNVLLAVLISWIFLAYRTRLMSERLNARTYPEFLGNRYRSRAMMAITAVVMSVFLIPYCAGVLKGVGEVISVIFGISYSSAVTIAGLITAIYLTAGGLFAVMATDFIQGWVMVLGSLALLVGSYKYLGGFVEAHRILASIDPQAVSMWPLDSPQFHLLFALILITSIGAWAQPQLVLRFKVVRRKEDMRRIVPIACAFVFIVLYGAYASGALAKAIIDPTRMDLSAYGIDVSKLNSRFLPKEYTDRIIPILVMEILPEWAAALFLCAMIAAAMSTTDSILHVAGMASSWDLLESLRANPDEKKALAVSRIATFLIGILAFVLAFSRISLIFKLFAFSWTVMSAAFLAPFILGLFWKRANDKGAVSGSIVGVLATLAWYIWGKAATGIHPFFVGVPISFIVMIIVSYLTEPLPENFVENVFRGL